MSNFKDIELPKPKVISDLEAVSVMEKVHSEVRKDNDGENYTVNFILKDDIEYRVPNSVIKQVQDLIVANGVTTFKVIKTGEGMQTKYSIQVLEAKK